MAQGDPPTATRYVPLMTTTETGTRDPDALVRRAGIRADTRQDQHFLVDDRVLDRIPEYLPTRTLDLSHVLESAEARVR